MISQPLPTLCCSHFELTKQSIPRTDMVSQQPPPEMYLPPGYVPTDSDILCGRGKRSMRHDGNEMMLAIVRSNLNNYSAAPTQRLRSAVVTNVVNCLSWAGLRFLRYDKARNQYKQLGPNRAHEKVGKAIRDLLSKSSKGPLETIRKEKARKLRKDTAGDRLPTEIYSSAAASRTHVEQPAILCAAETVQPKPFDCQMLKDLFSLSKNTIAGAESGEVGDQIGKLQIGLKHELSFELKLSSHDMNEEDEYSTDSSSEESRATGAEAIKSHTESKGGLADDLSLAANQKKEEEEDPSTDTLEELSVSLLPLDSQIDFELQDIQRVWELLDSL